MPTASASAEALNETLRLFDAQTSAWDLSNPHTLANVRFVLRRTLQGKMTEEDLLGTVRHYFKDTHWRASFESWLLGLVRDEP